MCGIFGYWGSSLTAHQEAAVLQSLEGRGPDDNGIYRWDGSGQPLTLIHTRLAIQDLSPLGHQPMGLISEDLWIVFNGEIYNQLELRRELECSGIIFRSHSDTEVILQGFLRWREGLWERLNGIFAIAIWDGCARRLTLARDPEGVKPLLWLRQGRSVAFASELSAFEACGLASRSSPSAHGLESYALWGAVAAPHTLLEGVEVFPPGHWATITNGHCHLNAFHAPVQRETLPIGGLLLQAVQRQRIGDYPVGLFLSGGLDSGLLAALMRMATTGPIHSLSIGFVGLPGAVDETDLAELTASSLDLDHHRVAIGADDLREAFDPFLEAIDQPSIDGFNTFLVAREARREGMVVAFSGLGADELFYGYSHMAWSKESRRIACRRIPASGLTLWRKQQLLANRCQRAGGGSASDLECSSYLRDTLLRDTDAVTMAQGLELRVPFLDPDLSAAARAIGREQHLRVGYKSLLLEQAEGLLPPVVLKASKKGFNLPLAPWLSCDQRFEPFGLARSLRSLGISPGAVLRSWLIMRATPRRWAPFWRWIVLREWLRL